ncbi:hypothetical protein SprV_0401595500 [Sparganum proliferum]
MVRRSKEYWEYLLGKTSLDDRFASTGTGSATMTQIPVASRRKTQAAQNLIDRRTDTNNAAFFICRRLVRQRPRETQNACMTHKAEEIHECADRNETENLFASIKAVYGPTTKGIAPLISSDGTTLLTDKSRILRRRGEHLRRIPIGPSTITDAATDQFPQLETKGDLDLPPFLPQTVRVVHLPSNGKAAGSDAILAEVYKLGGPRGTDNSDNYRDISLLNIVGKVFARILLNRLSGHLEQGLLSESQCSFRRRRGTTGMIFAARQQQVKWQEMGTSLYATVMCLMKAFDTVNRDGLLGTMRKFGCTE